MKHSPHLARLIEALRTLPGVGPKSAQRMRRRSPGLVSSRALRTMAAGTAAAALDMWDTELGQDYVPKNADEFKKAHAGAMSIVASVRRRASARKKA